MKNTFVVTAAAFALAIGMPLQAQSATQLIVNGSFEDGLNGWSCVAESCRVLSSAGAILPSDGSSLFVGFQNDGFATLSQTIDTVAGTTYDFAFFSATTLNVVGNELRYSLDGGAEVEIPRPVGVLEQTTDSFIASGTTSVISIFFETNTGNGGWGIDQVSVMAADVPSEVPLPATAPLLAAALGVFGLAGLRRRARS
ncbi:MAG: PEP-CTERM sorting domain-containing protein [Paracoccaceae bacterium]